MKKKKINITITTDQEKISNLEPGAIGVLSNIHYDIKGGSQRERYSRIKEILENCQGEVVEFSRIINDSFLGGLSR